MLEAFDNSHLQTEGRFKECSAGRKNRVFQVGGMGIKSAKLIHRISVVWLFMLVRLLAYVADFEEHICIAHVLFDLLERVSRRFSQQFCCAFPRFLSSGRIGP